MQTPATYIRKLSNDAREEIMIEIAPDQAVNRKAALALRLINRALAATLAQKVA
jgi:hypothetical protein